MSEGPSEITDRLARLGHAFIARTRGEASRLSDLQRVLVSPDPDVVKVALQEIETIAHRLHGMAGTLGFAAIGEAAATVEDAIGIVSRQGAPVGIDAARALATPIEQLVSAIDRSAA